MIQNLFCEKYYCRPLASVKFIRIFAISNTVRLVQLVEHQIVVLGVVGSSPTSHPSKKTVTEFIEVTVFLLYWSLSLSKRVGSLVGALRQAQWPAGSVAERAAPG